MFFLRLCFSSVGSHVVHTHVNIVNTALSLLALLLECLRLLAPFFFGQLRGQVNSREPPVTQTGQHARITASIVLLSRVVAGDLDITYRFDHVSDRGTLFPTALQLSPSPVSIGRGRISQPSPKMPTLSFGGGAHLGVP